MNPGTIERLDTRSVAANLSIELTTFCNSACTYCFAREGLIEEASLTPALAKALCAEGYDAGFRHLHLTGGEPLLWPGLFDLLDAACGLGYQSIFLNTNGLLLTSDIADRLARYPCLGVSVSLHGPEAIHDGMHAGGAYRRVTAGMRRALEAGLALTVFTIIGKTLLGQLPAFAVDLKEKFYGVERLTLIELIGVKNDACDLSLELLDPEDFIKMVRTVSALNLCGFVTDVLNDPLVNVAAEMLGLPLVPRSRPLCRPGKLVVRANRDITLAHSTRENFGHYTPGMVAQVLADNHFREAVAPDDITCPACCYIDHCRRSGMRRPSPGVMARQPEIPYCQSVLACIDPPV